MTEFGVSKTGRLRMLERLYAQQGKPFDYERIGRTCSKIELGRMIKDTKRALGLSLKQGRPPINRARDQK